MAWFTDWIHKAFAPPHHNRGDKSIKCKRIPSMSVSSIPASAPVLPPPNTSTPQAPAAQADGDANDAAAAQPPAQAPLPPGQGTRVNQLV
jgi:hypothetical protein